MSKTPLSLNLIAISKIEGPVPSHLVDTVTFEDVMTMIKHRIMHPDLLAEYAGYLNWRYVAQTLPMSEKTLARFASYLDWSAVSQYQNLSEEFISCNADMVDWSLISKYQNLSREFVENNYYKVMPARFFIKLRSSWTEDDFDWALAEYGHRVRKIWETQTQLSEDFIMRHIDEDEHFSWQYLQRARRPWSTQFFDEFIQKLASPDLIINAILTETQIEQLMNQVRSNTLWELCSTYQVLSMAFIDAHISLISWPCIAARQTMDQGTIQMLREIQEWDQSDKELFSHELTDFTRIDTFPNLCDWNVLSARVDIDEEILAKNQNTIWGLVRIPLPSDRFLRGFHQFLDPSYVTLHASEQFLTETKPNYITEELRFNDRLISMSFLNEHFNVIGAYHLKTRFHLSAYFKDINYDRLY